MFFFDNDNPYRNDKFWPIPEASVWVARGIGHFGMG